MATMTAPAKQPLTLDSIDIIGDQTYADYGYPHEEWALLRREAPIFWYERDGVMPFWAVTKMDDLIRISKNPQVFQNAPRLAVFPEFDRPDEEDYPARHLLNMDPPEHARYRRVVSSHFTPRAVERMKTGVDDITHELLDQIMGDGRLADGDFVELFSSRLPLAVLADLLGVPRADWELMFRWTNEIIGATDPEYQVAGETAEQTAERARLSLFTYYAELVDERRKNPRQDIITVLATGKVDGEEIPPFELLSYLFLLVVAGNETTRNATTGGLLALLQNPSELEKLRRNPSLIDSATEEIVRWTSPVIQFCRTPNVDVEVRGQKIRAGENMCLFYPSANRDEDVFEDPFTFRVDRNPNPHVAYGIGEHVCLGANLARLELRSAFRTLIPRLEHIEMTGQIERLRSSFVGGIKRMPIRYKLARAA